MQKYEKNILKLPYCKFHAAGPFFVKNLFFLNNSITEHFRENINDGIINQQQIINDYSFLSIKIRPLATNSCKAEKNHTKIAQWES